jgi:hypothetical protein
LITIHTIDGDCVGDGGEAFDGHIF